MTDYNKFLVDKLEEIANQNWNNQNVLNDIKKALLNRKTKRSLALKEKIINRIKVLVHKKSRNTLANLFAPKNNPKKVTSKVAATSVDTRSRITTTVSDIIYGDTSSTISKPAIGSVTPTKNKKSRRSKGNHVYGMKQRKYALEVKSSQKKGLIFIGFFEMGEASTKAVKIVNAELKKHYDDWDNSYLKKRCDEFYGFTAIRFVLYNFILKGNEKYIKLLSNEDSRAIDEFINGDKSINPKSDAELRALCFKKNTKKLKLDRTVPQEIEIARIEELAQEIKPLKPVLKKQKEKLTPKHKNLEEEKGPYNYKVEQNEKGWSYEDLFQNQLMGTKKLVINETYLEREQQYQNLKEFLLFYQKMIPKNEIATIDLIALKAPYKSERQADDLSKINKFVEDNGISIKLNITIKPRSTQIHSRDIVADNGWFFMWDRGMDIFQTREYDLKNKGYRYKNQKERCCMPFRFIAMKEFG